MKDLGLIHVGTTLFSLTTLMPLMRLLDTTLLMSVVITVTETLSYLLRILWQRGVDGSEDVENGTVAD